MSALGYRELKKEQEEIILRFISGNDVFGVLPTGFGNSLCYTCLSGIFDVLLENPGYSIVVNGVSIDSYYERSGQERKKYVV